MELTIDVTFDGEVFRPNEEIKLKPNTKGKVTVDEINSNKPLSSLEFIASLNLEGPSDFSKNLDDYLYGGKPLENGE